MTRRRTWVRVQKQERGRWRVSVTYWIRGRKKTLVGTTAGASEKEVRERALEWVGKEKMREAREWATEMLVRRKRNAEGICKRLGV